MVEPDCADEPVVIHDSDSRGLDDPNRTELSEARVAKCDKVAISLFYTTSPGGCPSSGGPSPHDVFLTFGLRFRFIRLASPRELPRAVKRLIRNANFESSCRFDCTSARYSPARRTSKEGIVIRSTGRVRSCMQTKPTHQPLILCVNTCEFASVRTLKFV
jgi:hypothetical protein